MLLAGFSPDCGKQKSPETETPEVVHNLLHRRTEYFSDVSKSEEVE